MIATATSTAVSQNAPRQPALAAGTGSEAAPAAFVIQRQDVLPAAFPQRVVSLLSSGHPGGDLEGRMGWTAIPPEGTDESRWSVELVADIDGSSLFREHRGGDIRIGVFGYVFSADGALVGHISQLATIRSPWQAGGSRQAGLRVIHRLGLKPGAYSARLVIEESGSRRHFLAVTEFEVPENRPGRPVLMPPLVKEIGDRWVVLDTSEKEPAVDTTSRDGLHYLPSAMIPLSPGDPTELLIVGAGWGGDVRVTARVVDANGVDRARPAVRLDEGSASVGAGLLLRRATVAALDLSAGFYNLLLRVEDPNSGRSRSHVMAVEARGEASGVRLASVSGVDRDELELERLELQAREIGSVSAQTVALLLSGQRGGEIAGSLIWSVNPEPADDGSSEVLVFLDTDGRTLLAEHTDSELHVGFFAYVFSDQGSLVTHLAQGISLDLRRYEEQLLNRGLKFAGRFSLRPGAYFARLLVRNQNTGGVYLTQTRIDVPGEGDQRMLLPPIFEEHRAGWVVARQSNLAAEELGVDLSDVTVVPASRVVVETKEETELFLGGAGWNDRARITARVADSQGRQLAEPVLTINRQIGTESGAIRFFSATLDPLDLPPGIYTLEVTLDDEATGSRLSRYVPMAVVLKKGPLVLEAVLPGSPVTRPGAAIAVTAPALSEDEFAARYAEGLYLLGKGDRYGARDAVVQAEREALGAGSHRHLAMISRVERQIVRELMVTEPEVLRPVSLLHRDVFRQHLAFGDDSLAELSWALAAELAERASEDGRLGGSPDFAETLLVSLAADLIRAAAVSSAIEVLARALAIAPEDPTALLALGATYERSGQYDEALEPLRALVSAHPENAEGELRLAINLARDGKKEEAKERFRHLIGNSAPTWITVIAYQELARLLTLRDAEALLREGVERYPSNQALRVQLAYVLDNRGQAAPAAALVEEICRRAGAPVTSPRVRYPAWPSLGLEGRIGTLEREAEPLLSALVAALEARIQPTAEEDAT